MTECTGNCSQGRNCTCIPRIRDAKQNYKLGWEDGWEAAIVFMKKIIKETTDEIIRCPTKEQQK